MFTTPISPRTPAQRLGIHAILLAGSVIFIFPFYWLATSSVKPIEDVMVFPPQWVPKPWYNPLAWHWGNFREALEYIPFFTYLKNTLIVCTLGVIGTVLSNALVAYAFARIRWPGRDVAFIITISTMMLPFPVVMVPLFTVFRELHWIGTLKPLWVPYWFGSAFNIFLLRQFFRTIPQDLSDAGRIDGCSELGIFSRIIVPLSRPALAVVGLFHFLWAWNDFLGPLIYLTHQETYTLALGLQFYLSRQGGSQWHYLMAASTLVILPIVILFFFTQRALIRGISMTGMKG